MKLGYGTVGSGFYTDPMREPLAFLDKTPWRLVALLTESWLSFDVSGFTPGTARWLVVAMLLGAVVVCAGPVRRALGALTPERRTTASWLLLGSLLSLTPILAVVPAMRLLGICTVGIGIVVAVVLEQAWFHDAGSARTGTVELGWFAALLLAFVHLVHGPGTAFTFALRHRREATKFVRGAAFLHARAPSLDRAEIGIMRGMSLTFFTPFAVDARGQTPRKWCLLAHAGHTLVVRRSARTFDLTTSPDRGLFPMGDGNLFRAENAALRVGDEVENGCVRATILEVGPKGPRSARLTLQGDPAAMTWVEDAYEGWKDVTLPAVGFGAPFDP
jgi:hypothetical protein